MRPDQLTPLMLIASAVCMVAALIVNRRLRHVPTRRLQVAARAWLVLWTLGLAGWSLCSLLM
jgi:hypothetical protein